MDVKPKLRVQSGLLVRDATILLLLVGGAAAAWLGADKLSLFLLAAGFMAAAVRVWAKLSARHVSVSLRPEFPSLFPGQEVTISYEIRNRKLLPLVWLELIQPLKDPICLIPEHTEELRPLNDLEKTEYIPPSRDNVLPRPATHTQADVKRFSMILWHQTVAFETRWKAVRRGVFRLNDARAVTGDGLGLTQLEWPVHLEHTETITVYPTPLPVQADLFLKDLTQAENSAAGTYEDVTIIKSTRDYTAADPARHINWRLTAKGMPLQLNCFETVLPQRTLLIFDGESFNGEEPDTEGLEETISLLTGVILELSRRGISFLLSMPQTEDLQRAVLSSPAEMLYELAAYELRPLAFRTEDDKRVIFPRPSHFALQDTLREADRASGVYYICRDSSALSHPLLSRLESPVILMHRMPDHPDPYWKMRPLSVLKGGTDHE